MTWGGAVLLLLDVALGALLLWWLLVAGHQPTRAQARAFTGGLLVLLPLLAVAVVLALSGR